MDLGGDRRFGVALARRSSRSRSRPTARSALRTRRSSGSRRVSWRGAAGVADRAVPASRAGAAAGRGRRAVAPGGLRLPGHRRAPVDRPAAVAGLAPVTSCSPIGEPVTDEQERLVEKVLELNDELVATHRELVRQRSSRRRGGRARSGILEAISAAGLAGQRPARPFCTTCCAVIVQRRRRRVGPSILLIDVEGDTLVGCALSRSASGRQSAPASAPGDVVSGLGGRDGPACRCLLFFYLVEEPRAGRCRARAAYRLPAVHSTNRTVFAVRHRAERARGRARRAGDLAGPSSLERERADHRNAAAQPCCPSKLPGGARGSTCAPCSSLRGRRGRWRLVRRRAL